MASSSSSQQNLYVVYCFDGRCDTLANDPSGGPRKSGVKRIGYYDDHISYQVATSSPNHDFYINKIAAVPMLAEDGITIIGSCFLIRSSREEVERFIQSDPFSVQGVWESVSISRFNGASVQDRRTPEEHCTLQAKATAGVPPLRYHADSV